MVQLTADCVHCRLLKAVCERMVPVLAASQPRSALLDSIASQLLLCGVFKPIMSLSVPEHLNRVLALVIQNCGRFAPHGSALHGAVGLLPVPGQPSAHGGRDAHQTQPVRAAEALMREEAALESPPDDEFFLQEHHHSPDQRVLRNGATSRESSWTASDAHWHSDSNVAPMQRSGSESDLRTNRHAASTSGTVADRPFGGTRISQSANARMSASPSRPRHRFDAGTRTGHALSDSEASSDTTQQRDERASRLRRRHNARATSHTHYRHAATPSGADVAAKNGSAFASDSGADGREHDHAGEDGFMNHVNRSARMASGALFGIAKTVAASSSDLLESGMHALGARSGADPAQQPRLPPTASAPTPSIFATGPQPSHMSDVGNVSMASSRSAPGAASGATHHGSHLDHDHDDSDNVSTTDDDDMHDDGASGLFMDSPRSINTDTNTLPRLHGELTGQVLHLPSDHFDHTYMGVLGSGEGMGTRAAIKSSLGIRRRVHDAWDIVVQQTLCNEVCSSRCVVLCCYCGLRHVLVA